MINFLKELISSFKEGVAEGKNELAQEKAQKEAGINVDKSIIDGISAREKFGTALGAPFRIVIFGDWFTLFNFTDDDEMYPVHLYGFGEYPKLEKHKGEFIKVLNRDFGISDRTSCIEVLASYFDLAGIDKNETILNGTHSEKVDLHMWNPEKKGVKALICAVLSHIISASTDVGYLGKEEALDILENVNIYAKRHYTNWENFSEEFFDGESSVGLNNSAGKSVLKKYIGYLKTKKGSPWNNISWEASEIISDSKHNGILSNIVWAFQRRKYDSRENFNSELAEYQTVILKELADPDTKQIAIDEPEIDVSYEVWIKGKEDIAVNEQLIDEEQDAFNIDNSDDGMYQVELCARLKAANGKNFTILDLMYQLEQQLLNKDLGDHIFFEGLTSINNTQQQQQQQQSSIPTYYMNLGS
ncbi:DUF1266 domain-containing protein [Chryseobacterium luteum]|uniref:DUF1266 domain-containing protein n=1 Tax=Chryseobacterium luteum TaxID=421531 RepID=A0A085ZCT4_9FLAO|nr:DUF1266 domain-containing protein [Chryseobacterium luteum]KFF02248.1 hypothetical protein IX38_13525 [Chryseobacterium luteum]